MPASARDSSGRTTFRWEAAVDVRCAEEVARDESLLRDGTPAVRAAVLSDQALSVGVGVKGTAPCILRARSEELPVVRRSTGGTGILHGPGDLAWSVVLPRTHPLVGRDYARAYARLGRGVVRFLGTLGLRASWDPAPGISEECCLLGARGSVLTVDGKILGGAAQHANRSALLHHGIVPYQVDRSTAGRVFDLTPDAVYRLNGLSDLALGRPTRETARRLAEAIVDEVWSGEQGRPS